MENLIAQLDRHLRKCPTLGRDVYIAKTAVVLGDVTLGDESSVWYGAVLRGDINRIEVGRGSNIQDNAVLHLSDDHPCILGNHVTVGHSANVHACTMRSMLDRHGSHDLGRSRDRRGMPHRSQRPGHSR